MYDDFRRYSCTRFKYITWRQTSQTLNEYRTHFWLYLSARSDPTRALWKPLLDRRVHLHNYSILVFRLQNPERKGLHLGARAAHRRGLKNGSVKMSRSVVRPPCPRLASCTSAEPGSCKLKRQNVKKADMFVLREAPYTRRCSGRLSLQDWPAGGNHRYEICHRFCCSNKEEKVIESPPRGSVLNTERKEGDSPHRHICTVPSTIIGTPSEYEQNRL